jgi:hypothetical protein
MNAKFLISWLVMFILFMAVGFAVHGTLLHDDYEATGLMRSAAEQKDFFMWMILAHVFLAGAFTWIYSRGMENRAWLGQGLRFGLAVAFLTAIPYYLIYYCVQPLPGMLVAKQIVFDTIGLMIMGAVVAYLYRSKTA